MLNENKTDIRIARHKQSQEDFTPRCIIEKLYEGCEELFTDFSKTMCDPCAGIFYIIIYCFEKRLENCKNSSDIIDAISTLYGTELYEDNVEEGKHNLRNTLNSYLDSHKDIKFSKKDKDEFENILNSNFIVTDTFKWDYENWEPIRELKAEPLF